MLVIMTKKGGGEGGKGRARRRFLKKKNVHVEISTPRDFYDLIYNPSLKAWSFARICPRLHFWNKSRAVQKSASRRHLRTGASRSCPTFYQAVDLRGASMLYGGSARAKLKGKQG
jgi:hypothetical protein